MVLSRKAPPDVRRHLCAAPFQSVPSKNWTIVGVVGSKAVAPQNFIPWKSLQPDVTFVKNICPSEDNANMRRAVVGRLNPFRPLWMSVRADQVLRSHSQESRQAHAD
jgi:hypothetical protein